MMTSPTVPHERTSAILTDFAALLGCELAVLGIMLSLMRGANARRREVYRLQAWRNACDFTAVIDTATLMLALGTPQAPGFTPTPP